MSDRAYPPAGSFVLVRTVGPTGRLVGAVTRSPWHHAAVHVGGGWLVESEWHGARLAHITEYTLRGIKVQWHPYASDRIAEVAESLTRPPVGPVPYGFLDLASVGLLQYGIKPEFLRERVQREDRLICSQLVDWCFQQDDVHLFTDGRWPGDVTPADLGRQQVVPAAPSW